MNQKNMIVKELILKLSGMPERVVSRFRDPDIGILVLNEGEDYRKLKGNMGENN